MEQKFDLKEEVLKSLKINGKFHSYYSKYFEFSKYGNPEKANVFCIFHNDTNPSLALNLETGHFNCFGCGKKGDIFNFRMEMEKIEFRECLERFAKDLNISIPSEFKRKIQLKEEDITRFHNDLFNGKGKEIKDFLKNIRGLKDETLIKFRIGYSIEKQAVTIPVFDIEGKLICTKLFKYNISNGEKEVQTSGKAGLFGINIIKDEMEKGGRIFIAEGEMDAMILNQNGFPAVSGSAGAGTWKKEWSDYFRGKETIICYDSDEPGRQGAEKVISSLSRRTEKIINIDLFAEKASKEQKDITDFFIKNKKNNDDFLEIIRNSSFIKVKEINERNNFICSLIKSNQKIKINGPQDYLDNIFYYAIENDDKKYLLNSMKKYDEIKDGKAGGIPVTASETDTFRFSGEGILRFLENDESVNPGELFLKIKKYIKKYIFLKDENAYNLLAIWAMGTYVFRIFNYFPYIHLNAEKSSGKTLLMEILAPICFNGQITVNSTEAVIFRDIQNNSLTLFLDEVEKLGKEDKDRTAGVMSILKTGFNKSGMVKRCDGKNKDKVRSFSTYSPKMFAGINEIDDVLRDRIIRIRMFRKLENEICERFTLSAATLELQRNLRDDLYIFGLSFGKEIADTYYSDSLKIPGIQHLNNRELDIWLPLFVISLLVDEYLMDQHDSIFLSLNIFSRNYLIEKRESDELDNDTVKLLTTLERMIKELPAHKENDTKLYYSTDSVLEYFKKQEEYSWLESKTWLTRKFKNLEIKIDILKVENRSYRTYCLDKSSFSEYLSRYTSINRVNITQKTVENLFELEEVIPF